MKKFKRFYIWGMNAKFYMGIYFTATLMLVSVVLALTGTYTIGLLTLLQILLVDMVIAFAQAGILNENTDYSKGIFFARSVAWLVLAVALTVGASLVFGWFDTLPPWCNLLLGAFMLCGFSAMLFGLKWEQEQDTVRLNADLKHYQEKTK